MNKDNFVSLADILKKDSTELTAIKQGVFTSEKLGPIPFTAIDHAEYKQAKKAAVTDRMTKNGVEREIDDDKLMVRIIIAAVDKDTRSDFSFNNAQLLEKLDVPTADMAVGKLLSPGEIIEFACDIQDISGFGDRVQAQVKDDVKNS